MEDRHIETEEDLDECVKALQFYDKYGYLPGEKPNHAIKRTSTKNRRNR
ncbi:MAG TPA: hypothetical protein P5277_02530 [Candidatus Paceibacterota bacterium]|nr:hypothetical protein [Candidatus Paceibacterota bacterium]